ncbi:2Fe-2S iron-sulfur cluster-binding protein [Pseudonocardia acidicola]|uniref:2Fe-2S iron-sulfur cluster binding domain-containing protein n=1 Tax=Pseudonocardia acidicola TaxID=2724939 RepID=A0ABX1SN75_9PSEU|nr:2Fe-2S iron-sulfur cluster-binding protein [Pseudonocardia acidicola]NMI01720.1 2Fe-2S iron-sulfur cluster binding domain-containing protein [Pseudonocardia acidicola]
MTHDVRVAGTEIVFGCEPDETVLDAAERAGFTMPYSCRKGVCSTCEGGLTAGAADVRGRGGIDGPADGVLLCQTRPRSDLEIAPQRIARREPPARKTVTAKVHKITHPAADVAVLQLRFPTGVRAKFRAGQYLTVALPDGDSRNYSMANPPHRNDGALLHVRRVPGGRFSGELLDSLAKGDTLQVELPFGEFSLDHESDRPVVLVATGTGFAPVQSIVEDQIKRGEDRPLHLYWGARRHEDLYFADLAEQWADRHDWFSFTPVLSAAGAGWAGSTGHVHHAVLADHPDLRHHEVYACGNPAMTAAARAEFVGTAGLPADRFFCDAFVPSGAAEPVAPR